MNSNRCDIDKVIGPLFTVLSEQKTTLPYRTEIGDAGSAAYVILPEAKPKAAAHEFAPKPGWRIIASINSIDKAALYQMSFALTRRFGWIYVDVPRDLEGFLLKVMRKRDMIGAEDQPNRGLPAVEYLAGGEWGESDWSMLQSSICSRRSGQWTQV